MGPWFCDRLRFSLEFLSFRVTWHLQDGRERAVMLVKKSDLFGEFGYLKSCFRNSITEFNIF